MKKTYLFALVVVLCLAAMPVLAQENQDICSLTNPTGCPPWMDPSQTVYLGTAYLLHTPTALPAQALAARGFVAVSAYNPVLGGYLVLMQTGVKAQDICTVGNPAGCPPDLDPYGSAYLLLTPDSAATGAQATAMAEGGAVVLPGHIVVLPYSQTSAANKKLQQ